MVRIYWKQFVATVDAFQLWVFLANTQGRTFTVIVFSHSPLNDHVATEGRTPRQCHKFPSPCISCATIKAKMITKKSTMRKEVNVKGAEVFLCLRTCRWMLWTCWLFRSQLKNPAWSRDSVRHCRSSYKWPFGDTHLWPQPHDITPKWKCSWSKLKGVGCLWLHSV